MTIQDHLEDKGTSLSILDAKENVYQVEAARATGLSAEDDEFLRNFSDEKKAKVLRKIDFRLVPLLTLFYMVSYVCISSPYSRHQSLGALAFRERQSHTLLAPLSNSESMTLTLLFLQIDRANIGLLSSRHCSSDMVDTS